MPSLSGSHLHQAVIGTSRQPQLVEGQAGSSSTGALARIPGEERIDEGGTAKKEEPAVDAAEPLRRRWTLRARSVSPEAKHLPDRRSRSGSPTASSPLEVAEVPAGRRKRR